MWFFVVGVGVDNNNRYTFFLFAGGLVTLCIKAKDKGCIRVKRLVLTS